MRNSLRNLNLLCGLCCTSNINISYRSRALSASTIAFRSLCGIVLLISNLNNNRSNVVSIKSQYPLKSNHSITITNLNIRHITTLSIIKYITMNVDILRCNNNSDFNCLNTTTATAISLTTNSTTRSRAKYNNNWNRWSCIAWLCSI